MLLSDLDCGQLYRKQLKGNSSNHTTSIGMPRRAPFQDITNVVDSHSLSKGKQGIFSIFLVTRFLKQDYSFLDVDI